MARSKKVDTNTTLSIYGIDGKVHGTVELDKELFDGTVNKTLLYQTNKMYEANLRHGNASTKNRAEVSGGGIKPWRQKGTGRARAGSTRSPLWRHGGIIFGPRPRSYNFTVPKKIVRGALVSVLNARIAENMLKGVVKLDIKEGKTKEFASILNNLKIKGKALIVVDKNSDNVKRATRNIKTVTLKEADNINARDVLLNPNIIIEKEAIDRLAARLKK